MAEAERTCPNCGRPVTATARVCIGCGGPLIAVAEAPGPISDPELPSGAETPALAASPEPPAPRGRRRREAAGPGLAVPPPPGSPAALIDAAAPPVQPVPWNPPPPAADPPPGATPPLAPAMPPGMPPPEAMPPAMGSTPPPPGADLPPGGPYPPGGMPYPPGYPYAPAGPPPPPPPPFPRPDVSIVRAIRRSTARSTVTAGIAAGIVSAVLVTGVSAILAILWWAAHLANNCSAQASVSGGDCSSPGANGYLANLNAVLWQAHGAGEVIGLSNGADATVRIPMGLGIVMIGGALYLAGRLTVRMLFLRSPRDAALRSVVIAATYTAVMMIAGAALTARGDGLAVGPHYGLLLLWGLGLGFAAAYAGILRRTFPHVPRKALVERVTSAVGPAAPFLRAALTGLVLAFVMAAFLGIIAMATHMGQTADAIRGVVAATTTKPWPDGGLGTFAAIVLLVLSAPTWAAWVLAYSLVIPTVSSGPYGDFGLTVGDHDAYLWVVVLVPIVATVFTGFAAARLRRAGTVEAAVISGAGAGLLWAALTWIVVALLDGVASIGGRVPGGGVLAADLGFGPALGNTLGALLAWGVVGGVIGGYLALATVAQTTRLPFLGRYSAAVVGPPIILAVHLCPACSLQVAVDAAFCSRCGTPLSSEAAVAAAQRAAMLSDGPPPPPDVPPPALPGPWATGPPPRTPPPAL